MGSGSWGVAAIDHGVNKGWCCMNESTPATLLSCRNSSLCSHRKYRPLLYDTSLRCFILMAWSAQNHRRHEVRRCTMGSAKCGLDKLFAANKASCEQSEAGNMQHLPRTVSIAKPNGIDTMLTQATKPVADIKKGWHIDTSESCDRRYKQNREQRNLGFRRAFEFGRWC